MANLRTLLNAGINTGDAQILEQYYANEPEQEFIDGLEQIARCLASGEPPNLLPPRAEPWRSMHEQIIQIGGNVQDAIALSIENLPPAAQAAVLGAITTRAAELRQWLQTASPGKKRKTAQYMQVLKSLGYEFKYNLCTHEIEANGVPVSDGLAKIIRGKLRDVGVWEVGVAEDAYTGAAWLHRYHPIRDYLTGLKFNGGDPIGNLCACFWDEHNVFATWMRRWLVGAVARVMAGEQNRVLVLDGRQRIGKSHFVKWLASPMPEYYHEGAITPDDKDCRLRRLWTWIWEVNEFGSTTRRADREALKAFLTTQTVRDRKPYAKFDLIGQVITSFIGTANNEGGLLSDPTGNRRFMVVHLENIDWSYTRIDVDQVWAQAFDLYLSGEPWELTPHEWDQAEEINQQYQIVDVVEETIKRLFEIDPGNNQWWMATLDILAELKNAGLTGFDLDTRKLAAALTKLGLGKPFVARTGRNLLRGYAGIRLKGP